MGRYYYNHILLHSVRSTNADVYQQEQRIQHGGAIMWLIIWVWSLLVQIRRYWVRNYKGHLASLWRSEVLKFGLILDPYIQ
jgi:hypothetical protein